MPGTQQKSMLVITAFKKDLRTLDGSLKYELMLNPKSMKKDGKIIYNKKSPFGITGVNQKFNSIQPETINFCFTIDGTGVVKTITSVSDELVKLHKVIYKFNGVNHEPNHVQIVWGALKFNGRLTDDAIEYTLFMPNGDPLRADVTLSFESFMTAREESRKAGRSSPDLSHIVEVRAGDTLPLLCYRIYNDSSYYRDVARINNITNIRDIKPGTMLHFPPLR